MSPIPSEGQSHSSARHPEIFGLSDWVRSVTDQLAEAGYIAIAPDLLSGVAPGAAARRKWAVETMLLKRSFSSP